MAKAKTPAKKTRKATKAATVQRAGVQMTPVKVGGVLYRSAVAAFTELGLPMSRLTKFRKELKESGRATFATDEGKKYNFIAQEAGSYVPPAAE